MVVRNDNASDSPASSSSRPLTSASASGAGAANSASSNHASPMRTLPPAGGLYISAPGKIILFGEHAVVYGRTAVAGSIDLRTYISLYTSADGRIYLSLPDLGVEKTWMLKDLLKAGDRLAIECPIEDGAPPSLEVLVPLARRLSGSCEDQCGVQHLAILAFWYLLLGVVQRKRYLDAIASPTSESKGGERTSTAAADLLAVKVTVKFKLPSCVGLGSSGAYCVCIAAALLQTAGVIPPPSKPADDEGSVTWEDAHLDMIRKWAAAAESLIHGRASGLDAAVCTYGGVASFKPGTRIQHLRNLPDLRVILVNSKVERNTGRLVQMVKERLKKFPEVVEGIFNTIDAISGEATKILHRPDENGDFAVSPGENNGSTSQLGVNDGGHHSSASTTGGSQTLLPVADTEHNSLQLPLAGSGASLLSYMSAGKRGSTSSAMSAASGDNRSERGELIDTYSKLNDLCRMNNQLLMALGVGHPKIDQICTLLARYGIHPKMTGAGGGGSVFAFLKPDTSQTVITMIRDELQKLDYELWQPPLGGPGVVAHRERPELFQLAPLLGPPKSASSTPSTTSHHHHHHSSFKK